MTGRKRVLFVGEAVTLAHVGRPLTLARALDPARYEVMLACDPRVHGLLQAEGLPLVPLPSISAESFLAALAEGRPLFSAATLARYVEDELRLFDETRPDAVVGDFRLSLSVSARRRRVPYLALANACWSPYARERFVLAEHPLVRLLGVRVAQALFSLIRPVAFAYHALPLNRVRARHGLASLGADLRRTYTDGDLTLYADLPELVPTFGAPASHRYLGPVYWTPAVPLPSWWNALPAERPVVYLTLGSSGDGERLPELLRGLAGLPVSVVVATAGRGAVANQGNAWLADFLPGDAAAARAAVVVCNGGSPAIQQALAQGTPVIGVASNMDQHLHMNAVCRRDAGRLLRAGRTTGQELAAAVEEVLGQPSYRAAATSIAELYRRYDAGARFAAAVEEVVG
jgi:UDP:flavonoid glycosyltransferase YjiC (YdhE family)